MYWDQITLLTVPHENLLNGAERTQLIVVQSSFASRATTTVADMAHALFWVKNRSNDLNCHWSRLKKFPVLNEVSSFALLKRITTRILQLFHNSQMRNSKITTPLTTRKLVTSEHVLIHRSQGDSILEETAKKRKQRSLGKLVSYHIFDKCDTVRVGGQISQVNL